MGNLHDIDLAIIYSIYHQKYSQSNKNRPMGLHQKLKLLICKSKNTINKVKKQHIEWEEISVNHVSDQR